MLVENSLTPTRKEKAYEHLLLVCRNVQKRFECGYAPTFEQMDHFKAAIEAFDVEQICGHKVVDECDCIELERL